MDEPRIEANYLIIGAGAAGMAFADSLLTSSGASMVIVDRRDRPGGHWNDAYPFVRLHQPGRDLRRQLRAARIRRQGRNGAERRAVRLGVGSGGTGALRLRAEASPTAIGPREDMPMSEVDDGGSVTSLLSGQRTEVVARKVVDTTYSQISVPSTHRPQFCVTGGAVVSPPNESVPLAQDS